MITQLKEMDLGLKHFLSRKLSKDYVKTKGEIIEAALIMGYEEDAVLNALEIFMYCGLIATHQGVLPTGREIFVSDERFQELKAQGNL
jgi:hypothetical protein